MTKSNSAASRRSFMPAGSVVPVAPALARVTRSIIPNPAMPTRRTGALAINPKR